MSVSFTTKHSRYARETFVLGANVWERYVIVVVQASCAH